jgi:hypothetical protein
MIKGGIGDNKHQIACKAILAKETHWDIAATFRGNLGNDDAIS